ncbi:MAG: hypothetical protein COB01_09860 [Lutibacter sp.]|nr:MAG: hypothetical protein COB01_09860 [Lutibacter sp.]
MNRKINLLIVIFLMLLHVQGVRAQENEVARFSIEQFKFKAENEDEIKAEKGVLFVPENRNNSKSRLIPINFVRFKSFSKNAGSPIVYLAGGPGGSGIQVARGSYHSLFKPLLEVADVIVFDQRGTGEQDMSCPDKIFLPTDRPTSRDEVIEIFINGSMKCKEYWENKGYDLSGYTTVESAHDVDDLRKALGIKKISLIGSSYGSHYALAILKLHESSIDRVVIAGIEGLNHTLKLPSSYDRYLDDLNNLVQSDSMLSAKIPNLKEMLNAVLQQLEKESKRVIIVDKKSGENIEVVVGKFEVQLLISSLSGRRSMGIIPGMIYNLHQGNFTEFATMIYGLKRKGLSLSAMLVMMDGASGASKTRLKQINKEAKKSLLGKVMNYPFPEVSNAWGVPNLGNTYRTPVKSNRPVLIISGTMDARTPIINGEETAKMLPNSIQLIVKYAYHPPSFSNKNTQERVINFLKGQPFSTLPVEGPKINFKTID